MSIVERQVISNQLQKNIVGKTIVKTVANQNPHSFVWFATEPRYVFAAKEVSWEQAKQYDGLLTGRIIQGCDVHGTYNYLYVGNRALMFNISARYYARMSYGT